MAAVTIDDKKIVVTNFPRGLTILLRGAEFRLKGKTLTAQLDWPTLELIVARIGKLELSRGVQAWLVNHRKLPRFGPIEPLEGMHKYQIEGASWLFHLKRAILADEPGLGKTVQAIAAAEQYINNGTDAPRVLVLCKNTFCYNWSLELERWTGRNSTIIAAAGRRAALDEWLTQRCGYLIVGWSTLRVFPELSNVKWDVIIADESHKIKNRTTATFRALKALKSDCLYMLSATPYSLHTAEIWTSLNAIDSKSFTSFWRFHNMFVKTIMIGQFPKIVGSQNDDVFARVVGRYMLKRKAAQCFRKVPEKLVQVIKVPMSPKQARVYDDMRRHMIAELEGEGLAVPTTLVKTTRLRQIASTTRTLWLDTDYSGKLDAVVDLVDDIPGQIVVATDYRETVYALRKRLGNRAIALMGGEDYAAVQKAFREGKHRVLVMTRSAGGESMNFDNADTMIVLERPWNPADEQQLEDRIRRPATQQQIMKRIIYLHHDKSIDDAVAKKVYHRVKMTNATLAMILKAQEGLKL